MGKLLGEMLALVGFLMAIPVGDWLLGLVIK